MVSPELPCPGTPGAIVQEVVRAGPDFHGPSPVLGAHTASSGLALAHRPRSEGACVVAHYASGPQAGRVSSVRGRH